MRGGAPYIYIYISVCVRILCRAYPELFGAENPSKVHKAVLQAGASPLDLGPGELQ